ncbi:MAG: peptidoglycan DD-metalloendopeptidase family protein [Anaerovoracaceae bacterium]
MENRHLDILDILREANEEPKPESPVVYTTEEEVLREAEEVEYLDLENLFAAEQEASKSADPEIPEALSDNKISEEPEASHVTEIIRKPKAAEQDVLKASNENIEYIKITNLARLKQLSHRHRKLLLAVFGCLILCVVGMVSIFNNYMAYEYSYNGKALGVVKEQEDVLRITDLVQGALTAENDIPVIIDKKDDITFKRVDTISSDVHIDTSEEVLKRLTYMEDINVKAYAINVNGQKTAVVQTEKEAKNVLNGIKDKYTKKDKNTVIEKAGFVEDVQIQNVSTNLGKLQKTKEAEELLSSGGTAEKWHIVAPGETLDDLTKSNGMSERDIIAMNPGVSPEKLVVGSQIKLQEKVPMVTLQTSELTTYEEKVDFKVENKKDDSIYKGDTKVKTKGQKGINEVTARVEKNNGAESTKIPLVTTVEKDPVTEVVLVGTKKRPPTIGDGKYIWPLDSYRKSSGFGPRWGREHKGIDLACPMGSSIHAADGGTVKFSGYKGSFGYLIMIDHQNGHVTYYAHNSELIAKVGDKVYAGQKIAISGSTGRSTGPHCHFQLDIDGVAVDPTPYMEDNKGKVN